MDIVRRPLDGDQLGVRAAPGDRLAGGLVIDASIVARLLGLRLLALDARIRFVPAQFTTSVPASPSTWPPPPGPPWGPGEPWAPPGQQDAQPGGLDDAADLLAHAGRTLDQVSQDLNASLRSTPD